MTVKLDKSPSNTVVIWCTRCPHWSAIRFGIESAHECAIGHELAQHPGTTQARKAAQKWRARTARHADDSSNVGTPRGV